MSDGALNMPRPSLNLDSTFGLWTVTGTTSTYIKKLPCFPCKCACGTERLVNYYNLITGKSKNCGCVRDAAGSTHPTFKHGAKGTPEYNAWKKMIGRCTNPNEPSWANYGGRGIRVHDQWRSDFLGFLDHIGPRPSSDHSIDRIDNNGNYEPGNVRWATRKVQSMNKRTNRIITFRGVAQTVTEHAMTKHSVSLGLTPKVVMDRLNKLGWSVNKSLTSKNRFLP
jgi:hypothetical protein